MQPITVAERHKADPIEQLEWERYRELICNLVQDKKKSWKDIILHMQDQYGFRATEAQYHKQCRKWGVFKNKKKRPKLVSSEGSDEDTESENPRPSFQTTDGSGFQKQPTGTVAAETQTGFEETQYDTNPVDSDMLMDGSPLAQFYVSLGQSLEHPHRQDDNSSQTAQHKTVGEYTGFPHFQSVNSQPSFLGTQSAGHNNFENYDNLNPIPVSNYNPSANTTMPGITDALLLSMSPNFGLTLASNVWSGSGAPVPPVMQQDSSAGRSHISEGSTFSNPQIQRMYSGPSHFRFRTSPWVPPRQMNHHLAAQLAVHASSAPSHLTNRYLTSQLAAHATMRLYQQQQQSVTHLNYCKRIQLSHFTPVQQFKNVIDKSKISVSGSICSIGSGTGARQPLHIAAGAGSVRGVELLLKSDPKCANVLVSTGASALLLAAEKGSAKIVQILLDNDGDVNVVTPDDHRTALHQAAQGGFLDVVKLLLESDANPDPTDDENIRPLLCAAQRGFHTIVKILLDKNADPNIITTDINRRRPLHQAAQNGHREVVRLLLAAGAEPDEEDADGITPLWLASQQGHHAIVQMLLDLETIKFNTEVAWKGQSRRAIHQAAQNGHFKVVELLLNYGARADPEESIHGDPVPSPVWLAAQSKYFDVVRQLVERGGDINFRTSSSGRCPLHQAAQSGNTEFVRFAIGKGADLNAGDWEGWSPVMMAAQEGYLKIVTILIEGGADVNAQENDGATALWIASQQGHADVVKKLLENGAKSFSTTSASRRPIHQAAQNCHLAVVKLLVEHDLDELDVEEKKGWRALTFASQKSTEDSYFNMMSYLIDKGSQLDSSGGL